MSAILIVVLAGLGLEAWEKSVSHQPKRSCIEIPLPSVIGLSEATSQAFAVRQFQLEWYQEGEKGFWVKGGRKVRMSFLRTNPDQPGPPFSHAQVCG